ncbi:nucleotidyltransferase family protein [Thalassotalea euphylliae]|uniref:Nucleotidyltransferase family protein n=1 Tax=Thalassotalea euphylliae TaxID=1655234 RepID=A0A3E0UCL8_9GAMM|nr:nucleotidyltransferase family protein [Thalassotalea euphylliae]REL34738.1 nucleotidyltransferase family protein [Thalassotalea euphylliae]
MNITTKDFAILILAAGNSSRLGEAKQLVQIDGEYLLIRQIKLALKLSNNVTVVIGHDAETYQELLATWPVNLVENSKWSTGMGSSIACGVGNIINASNASGVLLMLVDQWQVTEQDIAKLMTAHSMGEQLATISCWNETDNSSVEFGPPVIFSQALFDQLSKLDGKQGAKFVLAKLRAQNKQLVEQIELINAKADLDTPEQLRKLQLQRKV